MDERENAKTKNLYPFYEQHGGPITFSLNDRNDSWQNMLSGLGSSRDKATYNHLNPSDKLPSEYLEELYLNDDVAARIIDLVPHEMMRQGVTITINDEPFNKHDLNETLRDALIKSRLYGAAFIYVGADDGRAQDKPLKADKVKSFKFLNVLSVKDLQIKSRYQDAAAQKFGEPELFEINGQTVIHETRLMPFYGTRSISKREFPPSVLQRIYPVLQQFHTSWQATAHLMTDAAQGVFKLKGLHSAVSSNNGQELLKRMELVDMSRSISRSILLDAEDEDFRRDPYSFGGIPQILEKMMLRLAAAARLPVSLLMGQAPAGMNATGESDTRFFYDQVRAEQESLKPKIEHLIKIMTGNENAEINIEYPALWQMTDREKAELRRMEAETDRIYLQEGVVMPEEIALQRFKDQPFNPERQELLKEKNNDE